MDEQLNQLNQPIQLEVKEPKKKSRTVKHMERVGIPDIIMALFLLLLCLTCILPFVHIASKSISSDAAVLSRSVFLLYV